MRESNTEPRAACSPAPSARAIRGAERERAAQRDRRRLRRGRAGDCSQRISVVHLRTVFCREVLAQWMLSGGRRGAGVRRSNKSRASRCLWVCSAPLRRKRWSQQRDSAELAFDASGCRTLTTLAFRRAQICSQPIFVPKRAGDARRTWLQFPPIFLMLAIRESRSIRP